MPSLTAAAITTAILQKTTTARAVTQAALDRVAAHNDTLNCFSTVLAEAALAQAEAVDQAIAAGHPPGALAGVPFAVKDLFDIEGVVTLAGSKINQELPPATQDATAVARLKQAGAILVGALNMDEYAYGFVTENTHYGPTHNPHDLTRIAGGSSGGSAAAVAAGLVPLSLGSDTNGSIRVPASLCGIFGLKPTYGRLSRAGAYLFSNSFDHIGPFGRSVADVAIAFDAMQGVDPRDPVCRDRPVELTFPALDQGIEGLTLAIADGYFAQGMSEPVATGFHEVVKALEINQTVTIPEAARARAAAYVITASEGSNLHLRDLQTRPQDFDPTTRDRFLAGAMIPSAWYIQAQRFRRWYRDQVRAIFETVDVILAPTTPTTATAIGQQTMMINGEEVLLRPNLGLYTQPLSFIGLPIVSVPVFIPNHKLPIGVQVIAAPDQEAKALRVAAWLEQQGVVGSKDPTTLGF